MKLRGLHNIRTLGSLRLRGPAPVGLGPPGVVPPAASRRAPRAVPARRPAAPAAPRTWLFVKGPGFARYQGRMVVEPQARPEVDVIAEDGGLVVLAEMPGAREEDLEVRLHGDVLVLQANPGPQSPAGKRYYGEVVLPFVPKGPLRQAFRNGILEVELDQAEGLAAKKGKPR